MGLMFFFFRYSTGPYEGIVHCVCVAECVDNSREQVHICTEVSIYRVLEWSKHRTRSWESRSTGACHRGRIHAGMPKSACMVHGTGHCRSFCLQVLVWCGPMPGCQQDHELSCTSWWCGMCSRRTGVGPSLACLRLGLCGGPIPHRSIQWLGGWGIRMCASSLQLAPCVGCAGGRLAFHWPYWLWYWRVGTKMSVYGGIHQDILQKGAKVYPASSRRSNKRVGLKGQLAPHCVPWLKKYIMAYKRLSTSFRFKNVEQHLLLGSGGNQNLRPCCRQPPARTFHIPVGTLRLDVPALVWVRSPNDGNTSGWR